MGYGHLHRGPAQLQLSNDSLSPSDSHRTTCSPVAQITTQGQRPGWLGGGDVWLIKIIFFNIINTILIWKCHMDCFAKSMAKCVCVCV